MDTFMNEMDILCMEACSQFESSMDIAMVAILEDGNASSRNTDGAIVKIINKIKEIFQKAIEKITSIFDNKKIEKASNDIKEEIDKNPSLKSKKVKFKSNRKAIELDKITLEDIYKARDFNEVEAAMTKYKKQRNKAIVTGTIITVSLASIGAFVLNKQKSLLDEARKSKEDAEKKVTSYRKKLGECQNKMLKMDEDNKKLKKDIGDMQKELAAKNKLQVAKVRIDRKGRQVEQQLNKVSNDIKTHTAKITATAEIVSEMTKSCVSEGNDFMRILTDSTKSIPTKVGVAVKSLSNSKAILKDTKDNLNDSEISILQNKLKETKAKGRKITDTMEKLKYSIENYSGDKNSDEYKNHVNSYNALSKKRKKCSDDVKVLKKAISDKNQK